VASATKSAELYTSKAYPYGRFEARMRMTAGDGVVSAFFLWKDGSEKAGTFWNELDYEKIGATCELQTNALFGNPSVNHTQKPTVTADLCGDFHVYAYEWTADYISWSVDGTEIRRETGDIAAAYAQNVPNGMQLHFNIWPGDSSFGGNFSPSILPVHQYIDWVQYSAYANGAFTLTWREDFTAATAPSGWLTGNWASPKNLSTHDPRNVNFLGGYAVLSLTSDDAPGPAGAMSGPDTGAGGLGAGGTGMGGAGTSAGGTPGTGAGSNAGGGAGIAAAAGQSSGTGGAAGMSASGATGGTNATGGMTSTGGASATGGTSGTATTTGGTTGSGAATSSGGSGAIAGGSSGTTNAGGSAGVSAGATGDTDATGGSHATTGEKKDDKSGCGCRVPGSRSSPEREAGAGALLLLALAGVVRRRAGSRA
jgi:MYXO-CTERM domain-containing protein